MAGRCPVEPRPGRPIGVARAIRIELDDASERILAAGAIELWASCPGYGSDFPRFVLSGEADFEIRLRLETRVAGAARCAHLGSGEIVVYAVARDDLGFEHDCLGHPEILAHELGHVLELADAGRERSCDRHVMAPLRAGQLDRGVTLARRVQPEECALAAARWLTWSEVARGAAAVDELSAIDRSVTEQ